MRVQAVLWMLMSYIPIGMLFLQVFVVFAVSYYVIYRKLCKGKKKINLVNLFWKGSFVYYILIVLSVTLFSRGCPSNSGIISLFYSYKDAWIHASLPAWRNIILNIILFVPLGLMLPWIYPKFQTFYKTYFVGGALTFGIESIQLLLSIGTFEIADLFNNLLGTMIGYGLYVLVHELALLIKKEKTNPRKAILFQTPLVLTVCMFLIIFIKYEMQELGNLTIEYISAYDPTQLSIQSDEMYDSKEREVSVYQTKTYTLQEMEDLAKQLLKELGVTLDPERTDVYDECVYLWSKDSRYNLVIDKNGGTYSITDFNTKYPVEEDEITEVENADENTIRRNLKSYGITLPEESSFAFEPDRGYVFEFDLCKEDEVVYDGQFRCKFYSNGKFGEIENHIFELHQYQKKSVISEQEAYEKILKGEFAAGVDPGSYIEVGHVSMEYMLDTKGFYQPIYVFHSIIENEAQDIQIPALQNKGRLKSPWSFIKT